MNFATKVANIAFNFVRHANETDRDTARSRPKHARIQAGHSRKTTGSSERSLEFLRCQVFQQLIAKQFLARRNLLTIRGLPLDQLADFARGLRGRDPFSAILPPDDEESFDDLTDDGPPFADSPRLTSRKIGRNDPCSCGSGKKFKKCCGKVS